MTQETGSKACPVCGETIKAAAIKCRFCNTDLTAFAAAKAAELETDLFSGHPAMIYNATQLMPIPIVLVAAFLLYCYVGDRLDLWYVAAGAAALLMLIYIRYWLQSATTRFRVTSQRIRVERGALSKVQENLELFRIDHFEIRKPFNMRLMGQSELHLFTSDQELGSFYLYAIPNLEALADTLRESQLRERARRGLTTFVKA